MSTIAQPGAYAKHIARQKAAGRRLHRRATRANTTPAQRARYVAESIALRQDEGRAWDWRTYGLEGNAEQQARVRDAYAAITGGELA